MSIPVRVSFSDGVPVGRIQFHDDRGWVANPRDEQA